MSKTIIDYYYEPSNISPDVYVESMLYVENSKQYLLKSLIEIDPKEIQIKYYDVLNETANEARWNFRPATVLKHYHSEKIEHTTEEQFEWFGDHRSLIYYEECAYDLYDLVKTIKEDEEMSIGLDAYYGCPYAMDALEKM